jgi:hypothetical protein
MHARDRLIKRRTAVFECPNPFIGEIFASRIGAYTCNLDFLIEVTVSPAMMSVYELSPGRPGITNIPRRKTIAPGIPSIVVDDD